MRKKFLRRKSRRPLCVGMNVLVQNKRRESSRIVTKDFLHIFLEIINKSAVMIKLMASIMWHANCVAIWNDLTSWSQNNSTFASRQLLIMFCRRLFLRSCYSRNVCSRWKSFPFLSPSNQRLGVKIWEVKLTGEQLVMPWEPKKYSRPNTTTAVCQTPSICRPATQRIAKKSLSELHERISKT